MKGYTKYVPDEYVTLLGSDAALMAARVEAFICKDGIARVSFQQLASIYGWDVQKVQRLAKKIEDAGIWRIKRGDGKGHFTEWQRVLNLISFDDEKGIKNNTLKGYQNQYPLNKDNNNKEEKKIIIKKDSDMSDKRFIKPSVEEVRAYCAERNNGIDAEHFIDFYEQKGWMVGKNHMKDWRAAVRTWEYRNKEEQTKRLNSYGRGNKHTPADAAAAAAVGIALADAELAEGY